MMYVVNALLRLRGQKYDLFLKNANLKAKKINMIENIRKKIVRFNDLWNNTIIRIKIKEVNIKLS